MTSIVILLCVGTAAVLGGYAAKQVTTQQDREQQGLVRIKAEKPRQRRRD